MGLVLESGLAFALGIASGLEKAIPWWGWCLLLVGGTGLLVWLHRRQKGRDSWRWVCWVVIFCLGGLRAGVATTAQQRLAPLVDQQICLTGRVVPGSLRPGRPGSLSFLLEEERGRVRVFVRKAGKFSPRQGTVQVQGVFRAPDGFYNPGQLDPELRAAIAGEGGSLEAEGRDCRVLDSAPRWQDWLFALGGNLRNQLRQAMGPADSALLEGMLLGAARELLLNGFVCSSAVGSAICFLFRAVMWLCSWVCLPPGRLCCTCPESRERCW